MLRIVTVRNIYNTVFDVTVESNALINLVLCFEACPDIYCYKVDRGVSKEEFGIGVEGAPKWVTHITKNFLND